MIGEGSRRVAQGGRNEEEQTFSDSTYQVEFQKRWRSLMWVAVYYPLRHLRSSHLLDSSGAGMRVNGVPVWVGQYLGSVGSLL